jgi:hypothetical protein
MTLPLADRALPQGLNIFLIGVLFCGCKKSFVCLLEIVGSRCMLGTGHDQLSEGKCGSDARVVRGLLNLRLPACRGINILRAWCASGKPNRPLRKQTGRQRVAQQLHRGHFSKSAKREGSHAGAEQWAIFFGRPAKRWYFGTGNGAFERHPSCRGDRHHRHE